MKAPPSASVLASMPATSSATISARIDRAEADQEADGARGRRVQAPEQRRPEPAADVARDRPAEDHEQQDRDDRDRRFERRFQVLVRRVARGVGAGDLVAEQARRGCRRSRRSPTNSGSSTSTSSRARLTTRGLICLSSPTSFQAWLRVSNIFGGVLGIGIAHMMAASRASSGRAPGVALPFAAMSNLRTLVIPAVILGIVLVIVAVIYFVEPAHSLPSFFPGHVSATRRRGEPPPHQARHRRAGRRARLLRLRLVRSRGPSSSAGLSARAPERSALTAKSIVQKAPNADAVDAERRQPVGLEEAQQELDREERRQRPRRGRRRAPGRARPRLRDRAVRAASAPPRRRSRASRAGSRSAPRPRSRGPTAGRRPS